MRLALFFTRNVSLHHWVESGLFDREKLLYEQMLRNGFCSHVDWFTYDEKTKGKDDAQLAAHMQATGRLDRRIAVHGKPVWLPGRLGSLIWSLLLPLARRHVLRRADILKSNQMDGAWAPLLAGKLFGRPVYLRTGYTLSQLAEAKRTSSLRTRIFRRIERICYAGADAGAVTSSHNIAYLKAHGMKTGHVSIIPNFVDTEAFAPAKERRPNTLTFTGRLHPEKNLHALMEAMPGLPLALHLYGMGPEENALRIKAETLGLNVTFHGSTPHAQLAAALATTDMFILPSHYEGMPKSLIEAMAAGAVCIATDVPGNRELIRDGATGILAPDTSPSALRAALCRAMGLNAEQRATMRNAARQDAVSHYSIPSVLAMEQSLLAHLTPRTHR